MKKSAAKKYFEFHGHSPRYSKTVNINPPKDGQLIRLGRAVSIVYECNKYHGGGDGKKAFYEHRFETPVDVCMDKTGKKVLYLIGNKLKVTKAGIEN